MFNRGYVQGDKMNEKQAEYYIAWLQSNIDHYERVLIILRDTWRFDDEYAQLCEAKDLRAAYKQALDMFKICRRLEL